MKHYRVKIPKPILIILVLILISTIPVNFIYTNLKLRDERAFSMELLGELIPIRKKISEAIKENRSQGLMEVEAMDLQGVIDIESGNFGTILMSDNGSLIIFGEKYAVFITQKPEWNGEEVRWSCYGRPKEYMPNECKKNS